MVGWLLGCRLRAGTTSLVVVVVVVVVVEVIVAVVVVLVCCTILSEWLFLGVHAGTNTALAVVVVVIACSSILNDRSIARVYMLALLKRIFSQYDDVSLTSTQAPPTDSSAAMTVQVVPGLFGLAVKALPALTRAVLQSAADQLQTTQELSEKTPSAELVITRNHL